MLLNDAMFVFFQELQWKLITRSSEIYPKEVDVEQRISFVRNKLEEAADKLAESVLTEDGRKQ